MPDNRAGKNIWFGVREFAMAAMMNGIALHGGSKIYGDAAHGEFERAVFDGGANPLTRFAHCGIGESDNVKGGQTA